MQVTRYCVAWKERKEFLLEWDHWNLTTFPTAELQAEFVADLRDPNGIWPHQGVRPTHVIDFIVLIPEELVKDGFDAQEWLQETLRNNPIPV